ncbi:hypothetical protein [Azospirillum doebereinerae]
MHVSHSMRTARGASKPVESGSLVNACLRGLTMAEAEHILAQVWRRIEEHRTEAPNLQFDFGGDGHIDIAFSFPNQTIAALILGDLPSSCPPSLQQDIARMDHGCSGYTEEVGLGGPRSGPAGWS